MFFRAYLFWIKKHPATIEKPAHHFGKGIIVKLTLQVKLKIC